MRIDGNKLPPGKLKWWVYHAEECRMLNMVAWVDDVLCQWAEVLKPIQVCNGSVLTKTYQAKKILILWDQCFVIINPVDDTDDIQTAETKEFAHGTH